MYVVKRVWFGILLHFVELISKSILVCFKFMFQITFSVFRVIHLWISVNCNYDEKEEFPLFVTYDKKEKEKSWKKVQFEYLTIVLSLSSVTNEDWIRRKLIHTNIPIYSYIVNIFTTMLAIDVCRIVKFDDKKQNKIKFLGFQSHFPNVIVLFSLRGFVWSWELFFS